MKRARIGFEMCEEKIEKSRIGQLASVMKETAVGIYLVEVFALRIHGSVA